MSRKVEFLSTIKPILDKKGAKQDAIELARELTDVLSEIDIGADGSGFTELKDIFNAQLAEMGKQPIVFSEGTLRGIVAQFAGAVSAGIKTGAASIDAELERLTQKRTEILTKRDALSKEMTNKTAKQDLAKFNPLTAKALEITGDLKEAAIRIREEFKDAYFELMDFQDDDGNFDTSAKGYEAAVLKAEEKSQQLMRMQKTLMSNRDPSLNKQREKYDDLINGEEVEVVGLAFEQLDDVFQTQNERLEKLNTALEQVNVKIQKLQEQKIDIISDDDKSDVSYILKSLEEIEQTRKRISTQKGDLNTTPAKELNAALNPEQEKESLTQLYNEYNKRFDAGADWEKIYSSAVRFVNKFESDLNAGKISKNRLPKYTELYDKLRPMAEEARESLKLLAEFKPTKGTKGKQQSVEVENTAALHENSELLKQLVGDKEKNVFYDSKTGKYSRIKTGDAHSVSTTQGELADAARKYDTGVHTHSFKNAAPSALGADNDIDTWIKAIDYIKKRAIVARDEVLSFDFSALSQEDLQKISTQYKEAAAAVYAEFNEKRTSLKIGEEFGTIENFEEALQVRLREEIEHIMQQFPGVMSSQDISLGGVSTEGGGALTPKQKADEAVRNAQANENAANAAERERLAAEATAKANERRKELSQQLDAYEGDVLDSRAADENLAKRKEIYDLLQKEGLLTDEIQNKYDLINNRLQVRADLMRDAEAYYDDVDDLLTGQRVDSIDSVEQYRKDHIQPLDSVVDRMRESGFFSDDELEDSFMAISRSMEERARDIAAKGVFDELDKNIVDPSDISDAEQLNKILQERNAILSRADEMSLIDYDHNAYADALKHNQLIEDRIALLQQANNVDDEDDDIRRENGALEDKLELLRDIAEQYGSDITQKQRDRYEALNQKDMDSGLTTKEEERYWELGEKIDEADAALMEFEKTYDRIILKLANGKKVEILPDDKGLKSLYEFADGYGDEFKGVEIENVSFERAKAAIAESDSLRQQLDEANQRAIDAENRVQDERDIRIATEAALSETIADQWVADKRARDAEEEAARLQQELAERQHTPGGTVDGDGTADTGVETSQMTALKESVEAVTAAVGLKTQAFRDEQTAVDAVVTGEVESLGKLEEKINIIKATFEGLVNNIRHSADDIGAGLNNVNINVNYPENKQSDLDQATLERLAGLIQGVQIKTPETAIDAAGKALATENTLLAIKTAVESINNKTAQGAKAGPGTGRKSTTKSDYQGSPFFGEKLKTREMELAKFAQQLMNNGQDTPKMQDAVKHLQDALKVINSGEKLSVWDQKFRQAKLAVGIDDLKQKPDEKESIQTYKNLIDYAKEYYSIVEKYEKAKENTQRKAILGQQKQDAEMFLRNSGLNLDTLQLGDEVYNRKLSDLRTKHNRNLEVIGADNSDKADAQSIREKAKATSDAKKQEATIVTKLISLYKELGQAKARQNTSLFSEEQVAQASDESIKVRQLIKAERAKLSSVDPDTDMRFKDAKATGYRLTTANAERAAAGKATSQRMRDETEVKNEVLKEQKQVAADLIELYKQLGQAEAKRDMTSQNNAEIRIAEKEVQSINDQIAAKRKLIKTNNELEAQFASAWMGGIESETKKPTQDLGKEYEKLGKLQADVEHTPDSEHLQVLKQKYETQKKLVDIESRRLQISDDLRDSFEQRAESAYQAQKLDYAEKDAKERDAARKQTQKELFKQQEKEFKKQVKDSQDAAKVNKARSAIDKADGTLMSALAIEGLSDEQVAKLSEYNTQLTKLETQYNKIRNSDGIVSAEDQQELIAQTSRVNTLTQEVNELIAQYNRLSGDNATIMQASTLGSGASIDEYRKQLTDAVMAHTNGKASITGFNAATKELSYTIQTGKYEVTEYTAAARQLDNQFVSLQGSTRQLETPMEKLKRKMSEILTYFGGSSLIYEAFGRLRQGIQYIREIDSALTELKKVTDETEETYDRFLDTAAKTADKVGSTITNIVSSTADWARLNI